MARFSNTYGPRVGTRGSVLMGFDMMGFDFSARVHYRITARGTRDSWEEPGYAPEYEVEKITLERDEPSIGKDKYGRPVWAPVPVHEATGALFDLLCELVKTRSEPDIWEDASED